MQTPSTELRFLVQEFLSVLSAAIAALPAVEQEFYELRTDACMSVDQASVAQSISRAAAYRRQIAVSRAIVASLARAGWTREDVRELFHAIDASRA